MTDNHANSEADRSGRATAPSLRYRVAKAIYSKVAGWDDFPFDDLMPTFTAMFLEQADAVIRELGNLRQEPHRFQCGSDGCSRYRIISDWTTDE